MLQSKLKTLVAEFYRHRQVEDAVTLKVGEAKYGQIHLSSVSRHLRSRLAKGQLTEEEQRDFLEKLPARQKEMEDFGQFLKSKFLAEQ